MVVGMMFCRFCFVFLRMCRGETQEGGCVRTKRPSRRQAASILVQRCSIFRILSLLCLAHTMLSDGRLKLFYHSLQSHRTPPPTDRPHLTLNSSRSQLICFYESGFSGCPDSSVGGVACKVVDHSVSSHQS